MAVREISMRDLEKLVQEQVKQKGSKRAFGIHRRSLPDPEGCNWYLMAETADGWSPSDLWDETSDDVLTVIYSELSAKFNLQPE